MRRLLFLAPFLVLLACGGDVPDETQDGAVADHDAATTADGGVASEASTTDDATTPPGDAATDASVSPDVLASIVCLGKAAGAYCGNDDVQGGNAATLYQCPGAGQAPTSAKVCADGCVVESAGTADHCKVAASPDTYRLPWKTGTTMSLTQDCNDSCCSDHVGNDKYAWDFAKAGAFPVLATRGGTITHLKINSTTGCGSNSCVNDANFIVIDHGDGTQSTYLHLQGMTLASGVTCGGKVTRGQVLATAGTTGWSTGIHLHYQVSNVHNGAPTCACGAAGTSCAANTVPWANFWASATYPTVAMAFDEWPAASQCANRRITMPASQN